MADLVPYEGRAALGPQGESWGPRVPYAEGYPEPPTESVGLKEYLAIVRRQIWVVLAIVAAAVAISLYVVLTAPPRYRAVSVVRLADARRAMTGSLEAGAYDQVLGRETDVLLSQIQVLMSRQVAGDAVDQAGLRLMPVAAKPYVKEVTDVVVAADAVRDTLTMTFGTANFTASVRGSEPVAGTYGQPVTVGGVQLTVSQKPSVGETSFFVASRDEAMGSLLESFNARPRPKTDIIDLEFVANDPTFAQKVANTMALTFKLHNTANAQQQSRRRRLFLEEQMKQTDAMLQTAMNNYSSFLSRRQVFSSREKATAQEQGIVNVEIRRAELDAQRRTYRNLLEQARRSSDAGGLRALVSAPGIAANPVIQQLYEQLTGYERARDSLVTAGAAKTNPDVIGLNSLIDATSTNLLSAVRNQATALDASIAALDNLKSQSTAQIAAAPSTATEEAQLAQQVAAVQKMAENLQTEHQRAKMAEAVEAGQVEIVDLADVPTFPIAAGRTRKVALGLVIGLLLGVGAAVLIDGMNTSIKRRDDIQRVMQIPGLAVIPRLMETTGQGRIARALPRLRSNGNGTRRSRADGLVTIHDARSSGAEAYRTLSTNLIFSQAVQALRTLVVTSASPGEGKTTTAANLAVSFAQQGMRVLIVDCDLRRSRLHKVFSVPREPGLTDVIIGQVEQDAVIRETSVPGLSVLSSGQLPPNPSELLGGQRMQKVLASLSEAFDLILLDTPPLLAASDGAILATLADGVVIVVKAGATEQEAAQQAMQQLTAVGARVVGAVLNDPESKLESYGGYYKYEYAAES